MLAHKSRIVLAHKGRVASSSRSKLTRHVRACAQDEVQPRNVLSDLSASLASIDFVPIRAGDAAQDPVVHICYDFPAHSGDCPLLLAPPKDFKIEAQAAAAEAKNRPRSTPSAGTPAAAPPTPSLEKAKIKAAAGRSGAPREGSYLMRGRASS